MMIDYIAPSLDTTIYAISAVMPSSDSEWDGVSPAHF
jgi:hypothetical protein